MENDVPCAWTCAFSALFTWVLYVLNELNIETSEVIPTIIIRTKNIDPMMDETPRLLLERQRNLGRLRIVNHAVSSGRGHGEGIGMAVLRSESQSSMGDVYKRTHVQRSAYGDLRDES